MGSSFCYNCFCVKDLFLREVQGLEILKESFRPFSKATLGSAVPSEKGFRCRSERGRPPDGLAFRSVYFCEFESPNIDQLSERGWIDFDQLLEMVAVEDFLVLHCRLGCELKDKVFRDWSNQHFESAEEICSPSPGFDSQVVSTCAGSPPPFINDGFHAKPRKVIWELIKTFFYMFGKVQAIFCVQLT